MIVLKSKNYLKFTGVDTFSFVDSLISNSVKTDKLFFSYLLGPDGKILNWFICETKNEELYIYQEIENLNNLLQMFNKYKIRINCDLQIVNENNEVSWLDDFVDYKKGCFIGQEQTSRIKFRGRPRRLLKTTSSKTQIMEKI